MDDDVGLSLESFDISGDSNTDGVLSPGESAYITEFVMRNTGASDILGLTGIVSTDSPYVTFTTEDLSFVPYYSYYDDGYCRRERTCSEVDDFYFQIALDTPPNTVIRFQLDLVDQYDNTYHLE